MTERDKAVPEGVAQYARRGDSGASVWYGPGLGSVSFAAR